MYFKFSEYIFSSMTFLSLSLSLYLYSFLSLPLLRFNVPCSLWSVALEVRTYVHERSLISCDYCRNGVVNNKDDFFFFNINIRMNSCVIIIISSFRFLLQKREKSHSSCMNKLYESHSPLFFN